MKISPKKAIEFLERFEYTNVTVSTIQEPDAPAKGFNLPHFRSTGYSTGKPKVAHTLSLKEFNKDFVLELAELQKYKRAVYFLVNESNGVSTEEAPNPTRKENIISLNACFCDTDNCPPKKVVNFFNEHKIRPHIVVQTSPKKYHFYFLIEPASLKQIDKWKAIQKCMEWLGDLDTENGMDKTMHDITQLMRLPGFLHQKRDPYPVHVVKHNYHEPYTIDELFFKLPCEPFFQLQSESSGYQYPTKAISAGERHEAFRNYALSVANNCAHDPLCAKKVLDAVDGFVLKNFQKPRSFLIGGSRRKEVLRTVQDAITLAQKDIVSDLTPINYDALEDHEQGELSLPDTFFYHAPGIVGEMTRHICERALYPCAPFSFASCVAMLGALKSPYITSELGHAPANYFLCLGPSGSGKNYPQEVLSATMSNLGIPQLVSGKVRSARGIERFLQHNNSNGLLSLDEAETLFASLNDSKTPHYVKAMKDLFLELYTKTNTADVSTGWVGDKKEKPIVLNYPRLNLVAYGVIHTLQEAFNEKSIKDGLLQRFVVLTHMRKREMNPNFTPATSLNGNIISDLKEMLIEAKILTLEKENKIEDLKKKFAETKDKEKKLSIKNEIARLNKKEDADKKVLDFNDDARKLLINYGKKLDGLANREMFKDHGYEGLYTRGMEQVGRLATAICQEKRIDAQLVQYCIDLIDSRIEALRRFAYENMGLSHYEMSKEKLFKFIIKRYKDSRKPVSYRYVARSYRGAKSRQYLRELIDGIYEDGRIRMVNAPSAGGRNKAGEEFIPSSLIDEEL